MVCPSSSSTTTINHTRERIVFISPVEFNAKSIEAAVLVCGGQALSICSFWILTCHLTGDKLSAFLNIYDNQSSAYSSSIGYALPNLQDLPRTAAQSPQHSLTEISKYHFNFCCQHQITYFISCPVKHRKATCRISFASVVRPCLSQRLARLPTDSFNYGQISDRFAVDSPHKSKSRDGCLAARSLKPVRFTSWNSVAGRRDT